MEKKKSRKPATRLVILSIDEFVNLNNSGRIRLSKGRSRAHAKTKSISYSIFNILLKNAPDVGLNAESYVIISCQNKPEDFLDIRNIQNCWAINTHAASLIDLKAYPYGDYLWEEYIQEKIIENKKYNGSFFLEILNEYKLHDASIDLLKFSLSANVAPNVSGLTPKEASSLSKVIMTYAFGWKAALTVLRRLAKCYAGNEWKNYWNVPSVVDELDNIRMTINSGNILSHQIYHTLRPLVKNLWSINEFPKIHLAYLAVIFHYGGFAENDKDFSINDFRMDLDIIKQECGSEWAYMAVYLIGQCLNGKQLMNIYHSLKNHNIVPIQETAYTEQVLPMVRDFSHFTRQKITT